MRHLCLILFGFFWLGTNAQEQVGPYYVDQPVVDTIYTGTYGSDGQCPDQVQDVLLMTGELLPYASGLNLELHILSTPSPVYVDGEQISTGQVLAITDTSFNFGIDFDTSGTLAVAVIASGTPDSVGQEHVCWVQQLHTTANCDNVWQLSWGESFIPCYVQSNVSINEPSEHSLLVVADRGNLKVQSELPGRLLLFGVDGRLLSTHTFGQGSTYLPSQAQSTFIIYQAVIENEVISGKVVLPR